MKIKLVSILALALLLPGCSLFATPQDFAQADSIRVQNDYAAKHNTIQLQYEQERADIMAVAQAEIDKQRALNNLSVQLEQDLKELELWYQGRQADIQGQIDRARADALRDVVIAIALAVGAAVCLILTGHGVGYFFLAKGRNLGDTIRIEPGKALVRPEGIYIPARVPGSYQLIHKPGLLERGARITAFLIGVARRENPAPPDLSTWVQLPKPDEIMPEVLERAQAAELLAAAMQGGGELEVKRAAVEGAAGVARSIFGVGLAQLPAPRTVVVRPDDLARLDSAGGARDE